MNNNIYFELPYLYARKDNSFFLVIQGYNGVPKVYIATQAPLETTVKDFWSMVWENQSQVIVMMMDWVEDGQVCTQ